GDLWRDDERSLFAGDRGLRLMEGDDGRC
ncbi:unnamed protein product, partial [Rotaria socialis]